MRIKKESKAVTALVFAAALAAVLAQPLHAGA